VASTKQNFIKFNRYCGRIAGQTVSKSVNSSKIREKRMKPKTVKEINAGVQAEGSWNSVCNFFKEFESTVEKYLDNSSVERLNRWRPREDDCKEEVKEKTAREACTGKKKIEKECKGGRKELKEASEKMSKSVKKMKKGEECREELKEATTKVAKAFGAKTLKTARKTEMFIYEKVMLKFNPYYFDEEKFSVNLKKDGSNEYTTTVNVSDENLRRSIKKDLVG